MKLGGIVVAVAVGGGFGAATSLFNEVSSPYGIIGSRMVGTSWAWAAEIVGVVSLLVGQGWAWAGLAVAVGWLVGAARGSVAGALTLLAATTSYYGVDSLLREEPLASYWGEMLLWWSASVVLGSALGAVGASIGRPGVIGLLAGLTVPVGAAVQTIWLPSSPPAATPAETWARTIVLVAAAVGTGIVIARFAARSRPSPRTGAGRR